MSRVHRAIVVVTAALPAFLCALLCGFVGACGETTVTLPKDVGAPRDPGKFVLRVPQPPKLGEKKFDARKNAYTAPYGWGTATLTIEPALQQQLEGDLANGRPQWGASVVVDVKTGAILALADISTKEPGQPGEAVRPLAKAASVFKVVTAAALLDAKVPLNEVVCGTGGHTRLKPKNIDGDEDEGGLCTPFHDVLPYSRNVAMAKLAAKHLTPSLLKDEARRFYFNRAIPTDFEVQQSIATIPDDDFSFATTAAGFGDVKLSALHGAVLAEIVANGGMFVAPHLIASVDGEDAPARVQPERAIDEDTATALATMMAATVARGTASRSFSSSDRGYRAFRLVPVAGKTGSLTDHKGYRRHLQKDPIPENGGLDYTWFVGFAPVHDPKIAIGVAMVNDEWTWYARALDITKLTLRHYFELHPEDARGGAVVAGGERETSSSAN